MQRHHSNAINSMTDLLVKNRSCPWVSIKASEIKRLNLIASFENTSRSFVVFLVFLIRREENNRSSFKILKCIPPQNVPLVLAVIHGKSSRVSHQNPCWQVKPNIATTSSTEISSLISSHLIIELRSHLILKTSAIDALAPLKRILGFQNLKCITRQYKSNTALIPHPPTSHQQNQKLESTISLRLTFPISPLFLHRFKNLMIWSLFVWVGGVRNGPEVWREERRKAEKEGERRSVLATCIAKEAACADCVLLLLRLLLLVLSNSSCSAIFKSSEEGGAAQPRSWEIRSQYQYQVRPNPDPNTQFP